MWEAADGAMMLLLTVDNVSSKHLKNKQTKNSNKMKITVCWFFNVEH